MTLTPKRTVFYQSDHRQPIFTSESFLFLWGVKSAKWGSTFVPNVTSSLLCVTKYKNSSNQKQGCRAVFALAGFTFKRVGPGFFLILATPRPLPAPRFSPGRQPCHAICNISIYSSLHTRLVNPSLIPFWVRCVAARS